MDLRLGDVVNAEESLARIVATPLRAAIAFRLARMGMEVERILRPYHAERRRLITTHGEQGSPGQWEVLPEKRAAFEQEMDGLRAEQVTIEFEALTLEDLGDAKLQARDVMLAHWLFKDVDPPDQGVDEDAVERA